MKYRNASTAPLTVVGHGTVGAGAVLETLAPVENPNLLPAEDAPAAPAPETQKADQPNA